MDDVVDNGWHEPKRGEDCWIRKDRDRKIAASKWVDSNVIAEEIRWKFSENYGYVPYISVPFYVSCGKDINFTFSDNFKIRWSCERINVEKFFYRVLCKNSFTDSAFIEHSNWKSEITFNLKSLIEYKYIFHFKNQGQIIKSIAEDIKEMILKNPQFITFRK